MARGCRRTECARDGALPVRAPGHLLHAGRHTTRVRSPQRLESRVSDAPLTSLVDGSGCSERYRGTYLDARYNGGLTLRR